MCPAFKLDSLVRCILQQILAIKRSNVFEKPCYEWERAKTVSYKCGNKYEPYDGEYVRGLVIVDGGAVAKSSVVIDNTGCDSEVSWGRLQLMVDWRCRATGMCTTYY
jgi:hypothetical protein